MLEPLVVVEPLFMLELLVLGLELVEPELVLPEDWATATPAIARAPTAPIRKTFLSMNYLLASPEGGTWDNRAGRTDVPRTIMG